MRVFAGLSGDDSFVEHPASEDDLPAGPVPLSKVYAFLVKECKLTYENVADLTDEQITALCSVDSEGEEGGGKVMMPLTWDTYRVQFARIWSARGKSMDWIRERWGQEQPDVPWQDVPEELLRGE